MSRLFSDVFSKMSLPELRFLVDSLSAKQARRKSFALADLPLKNLELLLKYLECCYWFAQLKQ